MTIELTDEEAALVLICIGRSQMEIPMFAKALAEESGKRKLVWTDGMRDGMKRHGRIFKRILRELAKTRGTPNNRINDR